MAKINTVFSLTDNITNPLRRIQNQLQNMEGGFSNLSMKLLSVNQALELVSKGFQMLQKAGGIFTNLVSEAGSAQSIIARLSVALGDTQLAMDKFKEIQNFASVTPFDVEGTAQAYIMLKNAGMETEELLPMIRMIGDLAQGNNQAFNNMALNMMQIKASGQATAMDLRQFSTFGVPISQALKEIGRDGDKSFDAVLQAMIHLTSEGGKFYNSMAMGASTLEGRMANLQDSLQQLKATMGQTMLPVVQKWQGAFANFFESLKRWFNETLNKNDQITRFFNGLYDKLDSLVAMIIYVGTVTSVVASSMAVAWAIANWPITLTIGLIAILIEDVFQLIDGANETSRAIQGINNQCSQAGQTAGYVIGFIKGLIAGVYNFAFNIVATLYNAFTYVADFFVNIWQHPINSVARLFLDLANTVLQVLSTILGGFDWVLGTNMSGTLNEASKNLEEFKDKQFKVQYKYEKLNLKETQGIMNSVFNGGKTGAEIGGMFDRSFSGGVDAESFGFKFDGNGNVNVSDKQLIDIADDYRDLLSKRATERFNLQFSQVVPEVNVGGITVNNNADLDKIIEALADGTEQATSTSLSS